jgi:hypothetical protein
MNSQITSIEVSYRRLMEKLASLDLLREKSGLNKKNNRSVEWKKK